MIRLTGYTEYEKVQIAQRHLIAKQLSSNGLKDTDLKFSREGLLGMIEQYTREAGVRNLEREIGNNLPQGGPQGRLSEEGRKEAWNDRHPEEFVRPARGAQIP